MNLLVNAAHAIEKQGEINIRTWHRDDSIFVSIADTGCGISGDNLKKIFYAFFTTKEEGQGTGLGLSIAYEIVRKHNGNITVDSKVGGRHYIYRADTGCAIKKALRNHYDLKDCGSLADTRETL